MINFIIFAYPIWTRLICPIIYNLLNMQIRSSALKQIQSLGVVLPFDCGNPNPFSLNPIIIKHDKYGDYLRLQLQQKDVIDELFSDKSLQDANITFPEEVICGLRKFNDYEFRLIFIRRNYDGTELYYLVHDLHPKYYSSFAELIGKTKGGILL